MNKVILMGRLTRDPELKTSGQTTFGKFSIAVDRKFKRDGEPEADFFNCTAFGKQAEFIEKYFKKGSKVLVTGRVQNDDYEKDGVKHHNVVVMVEEVEFAESKSAGNGNGSNPNPNPQPKDEGFMNIPTGIEDELPFA